MFRCGFGKGRGLMRIPKKRVLAEEVVRMMERPECVRVLGASGDGGAVEIWENETLFSPDGKILWLSERLEKSPGTKALVRSIWNDLPVTVYVSCGGAAFQLRARVYRCLIVGDVFDEMLVRERERYGPNADIAAAWELIPEACREVSEGLLAAEQRARNPHYDCHLDRGDIWERPGASLVP